MTMTEQPPPEDVAPDWQAIADDLAAALRCATRIGGWYQKDPRAALARYEAARIDLESSGEERTDA